MPTSETGTATQGYCLAGHSPGLNACQTSGTVMREGLWATVGAAEGKVGVSGTVHPQPGEVCEQLLVQPDGHASGHVLVRMCSSVPPAGNGSG